VTLRGDVLSLDYSLPGEPTALVVFGQVAHARWTPDYSCTTFLSDGTQVPAMAQHTHDQRGTARSCRYLPDEPASLDSAWPSRHGELLAVQRMCWEHEVMHTLLARARQLATSPVLWAVAHNEVVGAGDAQRRAWDREEAEVLALQRMLNTRNHNVDPEGVLSALAHEFNLYEFTDAALRILRPELEL
jgi:hypothetical protein